MDRENEIKFKDNILVYIYTLQDQCCVDQINYSSTVGSWETGLITQTLNSIFIIYENEISVEL